MRCELAHRVADDEVRLDPAGFDRGEHGEARGDERRLLDLGLHELRLRPLEAQMQQIEPRRLARTLEDVHRLGHGGRDLAAHTDLERALPRETEGDLAAHSVHSIRPEPHVRPAPMPVINTRSPFFSRPSRWASASASGIEPEDVFP